MPCKRLSWFHCLLFKNACLDHLSDVPGTKSMVQNFADSYTISAQTKYSKLGNFLSWSKLTSRLVFYNLIVSIATVMLSSLLSSSTNLTTFELLAYSFNMHEEHASTEQAWKQKNNWCGTKGNLGFMVRIWWNWGRTVELGIVYDHGSQPGSQLYRLVRLIHQIKSNNTKFP